MKRVAAGRRLPIEDIKRAVNEIARGAAGGAAAGGGGAAADNLPAKPPGFDPNPDELRDGEGVLDGEAAKALLQHVYASPSNPVLPQELKVHQEIASDIGAIGAEGKALSIETQAQESIKAIEKRDEDMKVAKKQKASVSNMFGLQSAGKAAHFLGANVLLPVAQAALAVPGAVIQGSAALGSGLDSLADAAGAAKEGVDYLMEDSQVAREHRERAMPYTAALEEARYEVPLQDDSQRLATPRPPRAPQVGGSSSSSSSSAAAAAAPSYGAVRERRGDPLADVAQGMKGVVRAMRASGVLIGLGIVGNQPAY
jgi:hypothetical protein